MAKSDLLKQAIADAKAVKETALENAKIALQEAFAPKFESMFANKIAEELEDEEEFGEEMPLDGEGMPGDEMPGDEFGDEMPVDGEEGEGVEWIDNDISFKVGGASYDAEIGNPAAEPIGDEPVGDEFGDEMPEEPVSDDAAFDAGVEAGEEEDDLNLEAIIRELEGLDEELSDIPTNGDRLHDEDLDPDQRYMGESIDEIIEAILREEDDHEDDDHEDDDHEDDEEGDVVPEGKYKEKVQELEEAYATVSELKNIINEVNLLNAKLLYTNKLFRNFELNEAQKMKVIENFDRAANTREAKLVFTTLAESFTKKPKAKKMVKESYASKPAASTAPRKETTQVLSEGFELANRWKKLAGLI